MKDNTWSRFVATSTLLIALSVHGVSAQEVTASVGIDGSWSVDPEYAGSLGACELVGRKIGDSRMPDVSLVISNGVIQHRFKKTEGISIVAQAGQKTSEMKEADGTEYIVIDYNFRLNTNPTPHEIDFLWNMSDGEPASSQGICMIEGSTLWFAVGLFGADKRPSDFEVDRFMPNYQKSVVKAQRK